MNFLLTIPPTPCPDCGGDRNHPGVTGEHILHPGRRKKWLPPSEEGEGIEWWGSAGKFFGGDDDFDRGIFYWRLARTPKQWIITLIHATVDRAEAVTDYIAPVVERDGEVEPPNENTEWEGEFCPPASGVKLQIHES